MVIAPVVVVVPAAIVGADKVAVRVAFGLRDAIRVRLRTRVASAVTTPVDDDCDGNVIDCFSDVTFELRCVAAGIVTAIEVVPVD